MLNFIYHGEICLSTTEFTSFLKAAEELKIVGLSQVHASEDDVLSHTESGENQLKQENEEIFDESEDREYDAEQSEREGILSKSSRKSLLLGAPEKVFKNLQWYFIQKVIHILKKSNQMVELCKEEELQMFS